MDIWETIDEVESAVFAFEISRLGQSFGSLVEQLIPLMGGLSPDQLNIVNKTLGNMLAAMENKDYLLLSDLLVFELKPFMNRVLS